MSFLSSADRFYETEQIHNLGIRIVSERAQQRRRREFLPAIDININDIVDIRGNFDPRTSERNDSRGIDFLSVRMYVLAEEYTGTPVKLRGQRPRSAPLMINVPDVVISGRLPR